ncbi:drug resistance transporter, EmrB/QacA subfamily [Nakamurella panacisegetis]|uniref:Drug resistance transporter, EmrB/QacA subfamily n=1 Tax=Nakamurella panacisegetis TaxID=1090615 RepID=A0A1H0MX84_9ACTN|nr:MFS transporter [Nakamurella panacisegetis]SDO84981.1 drug resistance transporter, EmrB/QacA subfamily [Nakamurella panacisegetis]
MTTTSMSDPTAPFAPGPHRVRPGWTLVLVCAAMFMLLLDMTIVTAALANIQKDLNSSLGSLQWVVDAYTLPVAGLLLTAATIGDRMGRRRLYLAGMAVFTLASLGCALAGDALTLNIIRAVQGLGAVMLFGVGLPLIAAAFPDAKKRAGAIGAFGATLAAATAVGPLLGGALVDGPGWRWIFLINVPIGAAALVGARFVLTESRAAVARKADWPGTIALSAALVALVYGLIRSSDEGWGSAPVIVLMGVTVVLLVAFVVREQRTPEPMLDLSLLRRPSFVGPALLALISSATLVASTSYIALYFINTLGYTPFQAGLRFLPLTVASFLAAPPAARFGHRVQTRYLMPLTGALVAIGLATMTGLNGSSSWTHLVLGFVLSGVGLGMSSALTSQAALAAVPIAQAGMATGTVNTFRQIGLAAGVAALGSIFTAHVTSAMDTRVSALPLTVSARDELASAVGSGGGVQVASHVPGAISAQVAEAARAATAGGVNAVFVVGAVAAAAVAVISFVLMQRGRPVAG